MREKKRGREFMMSKGLLFQSMDKGLGEIGKVQCP